MRLLLLILIVLGFSLLVARKGVSKAREDLHTPSSLAKFFRDNEINQHKLDATPDNIIDALLPGNFPVWEKRKVLNIHYQYGDWR